MQAWLNTSLQLDYKASTRLLVTSCIRVTVDN